MIFETGFERRLTRIRNCLERPRTQLPGLQDGCGVLDPLRQIHRPAHRRHRPGDARLVRQQRHLFTSWAARTLLWTHLEDPVGVGQGNRPRPWPTSPATGTAGASPLCHLPAVLAGENGEHLIYFDVANDKVHQAQLRQPTPVAGGGPHRLVGNDLLRLSLGFDASTGPGSPGLHPFWGWSTSFSSIQTRARYISSNWSR